MKKLKDYIYSNFNDFDTVRRKYIEDINEYFNDEIPEYLIDKLNSERYICDYILENLQSHNTENLKNKIIDKFFDRYNDIDFQELTSNKEKYDIKGFVLYSRDYIEDIYNDKEFQNLIEFYGYYITDKTRKHLVIVPTYPKNVSDFVYKENHGILYHFTTNDNTNSILNNGLRIRKSRYREYPERIYLYSCGYRKIKDIPNIENFINKVVSTFDREKYGLSVFKIDLNKISGSNIEFYTDECMDEKEAVFTYNNIPCECIKKLNIDI